MCPQLPHRSLVIKEISVLVDCKSHQDFVYYSFLLMQCSYVYALLTCGWFVFSCYRMVCMVLDCLMRSQIKAAQLVIDNDLYVKIIVFFIEVCHK